jgi:hypothetical protein
MGVRRFDVGATRPYRKPLWLEYQRRIEMLKLSKAGKMPCKSWSLQAIDTCPGSVDKTHPSGLVPACRGCYATTGTYRFPNVKAPREHNREDWKRDGWVDDMVQALENERFFRWFDSGDCYDLRLLGKILTVVRLTPSCNHWLPTRMWKFPKFRRVMDTANAEYANLVIRYSNDGIHGETMDARYQSTIVEPGDYQHSYCDAYARGGKCGDCRMCWDRDCKVIAYPQHGQQMGRINLQLKAA